MRACLTICFALALGGAAAAQSADCDKIKYSTVPIEMRPEGTAMNRMSSGSLATESVMRLPPIQLYRNPNGTAVAVSNAQPGNHYTKTTLKFGFAMEQIARLDAGERKISYEYNIPINHDLKTDRHDFDMDHTREKFQNRETTREEIRASYKYRGSGTAVIEACSYEVDHFELSFGVYRDKQLISSTNWRLAYSPQLFTSLSSEILNFDANRVLQSIVRYDTKSVTADFVPAQE